MLIKITLNIAEQTISLLNVLRILERATLNSLRIYIRLGGAIHPLGLGQQQQSWNTLTGNRSPSMGTSGLFLFICLGSWRAVRSGSGNMCSFSFSTLLSRLFHQQVLKSAFSVNGPFLLS